MIKRFLPLKDKKNFNQFENTNTINIFPKRLRINKITNLKKSN